MPNVILIAPLALIAEIYDDRDDLIQFWISMCIWGINAGDVVMGYRSLNPPGPWSGWHGMASFHGTTRIGNWHGSYWKLVYLDAYVDITILVSEQCFRCARTASQLRIDDVFDPLNLGVSLGWFLSDWL